MTLKWSVIVMLLIYIIFEQRDFELARRSIATTSEFGRGDFGKKLD